MRIVRYSHQDSIRYGIVDGSEVVELAGDPMFAGFDTTGERVPLGEIALLAPVIPRSKIVCVGKNYREHAAEMGGEAPAAPLLFFKPNTSVIGPGETIIRPAGVEDLQYEGELGVIIGRICKQVPVERAQEVIFGYTIANDVTARDWQRSDGQWARAKGSDTFLTLGPWINTHLTLEEVGKLDIETRLNDEVRQEGSTSQMVRGVAELISYITASMTLLPGDVILTGTPAGVGAMQPGDEVKVSITGLGTLANPVADE